MSNFILEDLEYLGKVLLLTFMLLSGLVIYNQKIVEGLILISICCQILIIWILINKYGRAELIKFIKPTSTSDSSGKYVYVLTLIILFIIALSYLFRAVVIAQKSVISYGIIKTSFYNDIIFAVVIGAIILVVFIIIMVGGKRLLNKTDPRSLLPIVITGFLNLMLNNHIFHNF